MKKVKKLNDISLEGVTGGVNEYGVVTVAGCGAAVAGGLTSLGCSIASKVLKRKADKQTDISKSKKLNKASNVLDDVAMSGGAVAVVGGAVSGITLLCAFLTK